jgi:NAD(P)-dependent dehydrogenase (short-subunit alcohol dehydrogenase family)
VAILGRDSEAAEAKAEALRRDGAVAMALVADVLAEDQLRDAREQLLSAWGQVDMLVNAAGGHVPEARTDDAPAFAMPLSAFEEVVRLNLHGTVPALAFGEGWRGRGRAAW